MRRRKNLFKDSSRKWLSPLANSQCSRVVKLVPLFSSFSTTPGANKKQKNGNENLLYKIPSVFPKKERFQQKMVRYCKKTDSVLQERRVLLTFLFLILLLQNTWLPLVKELREQQKQGKAIFFFYQMLQTVAPNVQTLTNTVVPEFKVQQQPINLQKPDWIITDKKTSPIDWRNTTGFSNNETNPENE